MISTNSIIINSLFEHLFFIEPQMNNKMKMMKINESNNKNLK